MARRRFRRDSRKRAARTSASPNCGQRETNGRHNGRGGGMTRTRVTVAESAEIFRGTVRVALAQHGFDVVEAGDLEGLLRAGSSGSGIALVDLGLPPLGGVAAARELIRKHGTDTV